MEDQRETQHTGRATDESPGKLSDVRREAAAARGRQMLARFLWPYARKGDRDASHARPLVDAAEGRERRRGDEE